MSSSRLFQKVQTIFDYKDRDGGIIGGVETTTATAILVVVGAAAYYLFFTTHNKKQDDDKNDKLKKPWLTVPGYLPIIGHFHKIQSPDYLVDKTTEWAKLYDSDGKLGCYEFYIFNDKTIAITSYERLEEIMKYRSQYKIIRANQLREAAISIGFNGVFMAEGKQWKLEHKLVSAALNKSNVQDYMLVLHEMTNRLINKWSTKINMDSSTTTVLDVDDDLGLISADAISKSIMGKDLDFLGVLQQEQHVNNKRSSSQSQSQTAAKNDILHLLSGMVFRILMPIWYWRIPIIGQYLDGMGSSIKHVYNLVDTIVEEYENEILSQQQQQQQDTTTTTTTSKDPQSSVSNNTTGTTTTTTTSSTRNTFLQKLYGIMKSESSPKSSATLKRDRVVGNIITLFMAGTDTTSKTVALSLYLLAKDQQLQKQLRIEADEVFDTTNLSLSDLYTKMPRLKSFLQEVHRCYGVPIITLEPSEDIPFCGTTLKRGTSIFVCTQYIAMHDNNSNTNNKNTNTTGDDDTDIDPPTPPKSEFCPTRFLVEVSSSSEEEGKGEGRKGVGSKFLTTTCRPPNVQAGESLGFGFGVRSCPGRIYTEAFSYILLNSILRNFEWELPPPPIQQQEKEVHLIWNVTISPDCGVSLQMSKRTNM